MPSCSPVLFPGSLPLHGLPPPGRRLYALEVGPFAAREIEVQYVAFVKGRTRWPAIVDFQVSFGLVIVDQRNLCGRALNHMLGVEPEGIAVGRRGWSFVGNLCQHQKEKKDRRDNQNCRNRRVLLHGLQTFGERCPHGPENPVSRRKESRIAPWLSV